MVYKVENISLAYDKKVIAKNISFEINQGECLTFIGANGSGKSTILKALCRFIKPVSGKIKLFDKSLHQMKAKDIAKKVAILSQVKENNVDYGVETMVSFGRFPHLTGGQRLTQQDIQVVQWAMEKTGVTHLRHKMVSNLSGGERQRVWLAMALAQQPEVLILDEPTTYLDVAYQIEVLELIKQINEQLGITVIMVLHDLNLAVRYSHRIIAVKAGSIYQQGGAKAMMSKELIKDIFDVEGDILEDQRNHCPYFIPSKTIKS